jgi:chromosome segregation ATPase
LPFLEQLLAVGGILIALLILMAGLIKLAFGLVERLLGKLEGTFDKWMQARESLLEEKEKNNRLESDLIELKKKQFEQEQKITSLQKDAVSRSEVLSQWETRIETLEAERDELKIQLATVTDDKTALGRRLSALEDELDALRNERDNAIRERDEAREQLKKELEKTVNRLDALETQHRLEDVPLKPSEAKANENLTPSTPSQPTIVTTISSLSTGGGG